jgi:hypothetical protein
MFQIKMKRGASMQEVRKDVKAKRERVEGPRNVRAPSVPAPRAPTSKPLIPPTFVRDDVPTTVHDNMTLKIEVKQPLTSGAKVHVTYDVLDNKLEVKIE